MIILDGKKLSEKILEKLRREIKKKRLKLKLAVVLVGDDSNSKIYVRKKKEACEKLGISFELFKFPEQIQGAKLLKEIKEIIKDDTISGIVIQLPLPRHINTNEVLSLIPKEKDVEFFSPVVCAIGYILKEYNISLKGKGVALIGKGRLVGIPIGRWLNEQNIQFSDDIKNADVVISGVGKPGLIKGEMVKKGVIVIDIGKDVDFKSVSKKASYITPTPGGVGPMTVACLLENLLKLNTENSSL